MKDEDDFNFDIDEEFEELDSEDPQEIDPSIKPVGEKIIKKQTANEKREHCSSSVIDYINREFISDDIFEVSEFPDFVDYLEKSEILKLPISNWFSYEVARGDKKDKLKFIVWAQDQIFLSDKINDFAKIEILKIFNLAAALTMFRRIEWQIATA